MTGELGRISILERHANVSAWKVRISGVLEFVPNGKDTMQYINLEVGNLTSFTIEVEKKSKLVSVSWLPTPQPQINKDVFIHLSVPSTSSPLDHQWSSFSAILVPLPNHHNYQIYW